MILARVHTHAIPLDLEAIENGARCAHDLPVKWAHPTADYPGRVGAGLSGDLRAL